MFKAVKWWNGSEKNGAAAVKPLPRARRGPKPAPPTTNERNRKMPSYNKVLLMGNLTREIGRAHV